MLKTFFINSLKILVAGALIYWLVSSGKLDFKLLLGLKDHPWAVIIAVILSIFNFILVSYRWETILRARSQVTIPIIGLLKITWIGQFFSSVLPGSVSGDLVKILYVQNFDKSFSKKFVFASILIDRVMGLSGLILLVGLSSLLFSQHILGNAPLMKPLLNMNYILAVLVIASFATFFFCHHWIRHILKTLEGIALAKVFQKIISLWDDLVLIKSQMLKAIAMSLVIQFIGVLIFWSLIHPFVGNNMDFVQALAFIPLGLMTLALPVAPSGLGVGHAIFQKLFEFSGIENGASLFNLYFVVTLAVNVCGVIPYVLTKSKK
ncbi:MAG: flippase-like domain-containing protein [Bacteriovoracaceae bacterium]|nr:flippase-like domain-containing protein [Bacteriovoracaceae bacterium]